jgi:4-hydroxybenzoate polyprenyltransferase
VADGVVRSGLLRRTGRLIHGLSRSCHLPPCLLVTAFATAYAVVMQVGPDVGAPGRLEPGILLAVATAILAGQFCVGWSNDAIDAPRDIAARRADKPISAGLIDARTVAASALFAAGACVLLSWRLGDRAAWIHLVALLSALSYNAGLKTTVFSPLPYLLSFGLLPVIASVAVTGHGPPLAHVLAAALLGAAAHAGNTVGDTEADAVTGVRGLPQRLGPQRSLVAMALLIAVAAAVLLAALVTAHDAGPVRAVIAVLALGAGVVLALVGAFRRVGVPGGKAAWRLTLLAVALVIAGFLIGV